MFMNSQTELMNCDIKTNSVTSQQTFPAGTWTNDMRTDASTFTGLEVEEIHGSHLVQDMD